MSCLLGDGLRSLSSRLVSVNLNLNYLASHECVIIDYKLLSKL